MTKEPRKQLTGYKDERMIKLGEPNIGILRCKGEIDIYLVRLFKNSIEAIVNDPVVPINHLIVNIRQISFMDSSGFGILLQYSRVLNQRGGKIHLLVAENSVIEQTLKSTRFDTLVSVHSSEGEAEIAIKDSASEQTA